MKKIKSIFSIAAIFYCVLLFSSCLTTKTNVGGFKESEGKTYTYAKGKQIWIFWSLLPVGHTSVATPASGSCQVITRFNITDLLISGLTAGIVTTETIKVVAKKEN